MSRSQNEGLMPTPDFTPHRVDVVADDVDPADNTVKFAHGMDARGRDNVMAQVSLGPDTTSCTINALFWSDDDGVFVPDETGQTWNITQSCGFQFQAAGRRFFLQVVNVVGADPDINISVAAAPSGHVEDFA